MARLALDTSSPITSIAVETDQGVIFELEQPSRDSHSQSLSSLVQEVLRRAEVLSLCQFTELRIGLGPGSFTGLRIGLSYMKGLSMVHKIPLIGLDSFSAMALAQNLEEGAICLVLGDARRSEYFFAAFCNNSATLETARSLAIVSEQELVDYHDRQAVGSVRCVDAGNEKLPEGLSSVKRLSSVAKGLLMLPSETPAWSLASLVALEPIYLRSVAALTVAQRHEIRSKEGK